MAENEISVDELMDEINALLQEPEAPVTEEAAPEVKEKKQPRNSKVTMILLI